jgi:phage repressor protein C with HTH and peptisase S24 domain
VNRYPEDTELIQRLVSYADDTPAAVAKRAGVAVSTVNRPFNGSAQNRLGRAVLDKLQRAFPDFPGWTSNRLTEQQRPVLHKEPDRDPDLVEIAEVDIRYGLGGSYLDAGGTGEQRLFSRTWLRNVTRASPEHLFWAIGDGDSMEPTIRSGELILIDRSQDTPRMAEGIWAVAIGEIGMIKRLHFPGPGRVELLSDNGLVPAIVPGEDELQIIGRVVAIVRKV